MDVDVGFLEALGIDAERDGAILDDAQGGLGAFPHDIAELAGENKLAAAGNASGFDEHDVAANGRPCKPGRHARHARSHGHLIFKSRGAQNLLQVIGAYGDRGRMTLGNAHGGVTQGLANLALEVSYSSFPRVVLNNVAERRLGDLDLACLKAVRLHLTPHEVAPGDFKLFLGGVAG